MKKWSKITLLALLLTNIITIILLLNCSHENIYLPNLELYNYKDYSMIQQPLLIEYDYLYGNKKTYKKSENEIEEYLQNEENEISLSTVGLIRLDFWELNVVDVKATINGNATKVRRTDGNYYIDFEETEGTKIFEVTSFTGSTNAKYTFKVVFQDNLEAKAYLQKGKNLILEKYELSQNEIIKVCGITPFIPYKNHGYVFKILENDSETSNMVIGVDLEFNKLFLRQERGLYQLIN